MKTTFSVPGIHCSGCAALIADITGDFPQITNVAVDPVTKTVTLDHAEGYDLAGWRAAISAHGERYTPIPHSPIPQT